MKLEGVTQKEIRYGCTCGSSTLKQTGVAHDVCPFLSNLLRLCAFFKLV
jgi:hypothetical protein